MASNARSLQSFTSVKHAASLPGHLHQIADTYGAAEMDPTEDVKAMCVSMLVEGRPQAFVDFFYLTHKDGERSKSSHTEGAGDGSDVSALHKEDLPPECIGLLRQQLVKAEAAIRAGDVEGEYDASRVLAQYFHLAGRKQKAIYFFQKCLEVAREHDWVEAELEANIALGQIFEACGNTESALESHERSLELAKAHGWSAEVDSAYRNLVQVYSKQADQQEQEGNTAEALGWLQKCLHAAEQATDMHAVGLINYRIGALHQKQEEHLDALYYHQQYLDICVKAGDRQGEGKAYCATAESQQSLGNIPEAMQALETFLDVSKLEDPRGQAVASCKLGNIHFNQQQYELAVTYFEKFFELARTLNDRKLLDTARVNLGVSKGVLRLNDYIDVAKVDLKGLLAWKNTRTPFYVM